MRKSPTKILLKRISAPLPEGFGKKPASYMVLVASLSDDPKGKEIAEWLKAAAPNKVMGVDIEALVLRARQLENFVDSSIASGPIFGKLGQSARREIFQALRRLHTSIDFASQQAHGESAEDSSLAQKSLEDIQETSTVFYDALETPVLQELDGADHEAARQDAWIAATDATKSIMLRQAVLGSDSFDDGQEIPREKLKTAKVQSSRKVGRFEGRPVILETFIYIEHPDDGSPYPQTLNQIRRMSGLLSHVKRVDFHTLPCLGYFHDKVHHELGLVFEPPPQSDIDSGLMTLHQLYGVHKVVPLGRRIFLIHALAVAIERFHRVGWVHKGIRSNNIVFNKIPEPESASVNLGAEEPVKGSENSPARVAGFDLAQPCLFGFEYARAGDAGTNLEEDHSQEHNLYRSPDRWGRPRVRFEKFHDVYSLVGA